ncbi:hypothetical protein [Kibdelosporangium persicum]|uniref:hypothetical protein n=1 Tax=Kibdelosporangium persicum TaxID=2698649 RepID=UPI001562FE22|nr:hypothetical protein [Kibdelosporangium persicum]
MRVLVLVVVAGLLAGCDDKAPDVYTPAAPEQANPALAERFAPLVFLAEGEPNLPMDATHYVGKSSLWFDDGCDDSDDRLVAEKIDLRRLSGKTGAYEQQANCSKSRKVTDGPDGFPEKSGFYLRPPESARQGEGTQAPVYWEYHVDSGRAAYVYWFFYGYNDLTAGNKHEGDWERVAVQVNGTTPVGVTFFKHGGDPCMVPWQDTQLGKNGDHPQVYAAKGSHGSYSSPGNEYLAGAAFDRSSAGSQWNTWATLRQADREPWWGYRGTWGSPSSLPVSGFDGPAGPGPGRLLKNVLTDKVCEVSQRTITSQLPDAFVGEWETREPATQKPPVTPYHIRASLRKDRSTVHYRTTWTEPDPKLDCQGTWSVTAALQMAVAVHEKITGTSRGKCVIEGSIRLTIEGDAVGVLYDSGSFEMQAKLYRRTRTDPPPPADVPADTTEAALKRFEQYLHAVGNEDLGTVCEIAGPAARKAEAQGFGTCRQTMPVMFRMLSPAQKTALRTATVDTRQITARPGTVEVPTKAILAGDVRFSSSTLGDCTLTFMNGQWFVTD